MSNGRKRRRYIQYYSMLISYIVVHTDFNKQKKQCKDVEKFPTFVDQSFTVCPTDSVVLNQTVLSLRRNLKKKLFVHEVEITYF